MTSTLRTTLLILTVSLLTGCGFRLAYQQLDRLLPWYVSDYVTLDDEQRNTLDSLLAHRLAWHCQTQIPAYREWLDQVRDTFEQQPISAADLAPLGDQAEAMWRELMLTLAPDLTQVLAQLSDPQIDEILRTLDKKNRKVRSEHLDIPDEKRLEKRIERMEKLLRRWTGRLTAEQRKKVEAWASDLRPTTREWIEQREAWRLRFAAAVSQRADPASLEAQMRQLLASPDAHWSDAHRADVDFNRALTIQLIADVYSLASAQQRNKIAAEIGSLGTQLDQLACDAPAPLAALH